MHYYCSYITADKKDEWENLIKNHFASGFHQSFAWAKFQQSQGWDSYKIGLFDSQNDRLVGGAVILEFCFSNGTNFLYIPEGPALNYKNEDELFWQWKALSTAINSIVKIDKNEKTTHIRIEPRIEDCPKWFLHQFEKAPINLQPKYTQVVSLQDSEEDILAQMKQKCRYNINLAKRKNVAIREIKKISNTDLDKFYVLYDQTRKRNHFEGKEKDFFDSHMKICRNFSKMFVAELGDEILASMIIVYFGNRATYLYGASSDAHKEYMAPYALHWHIMQEAKKDNYKEYDLWGINHTPDDEKHPWYGITRFKKQFGGHQVNLIGAYDYIIQKELYADFLKKHEA
ncbi:MAG: peptidoglycan bridge formation glycyltransferase FemA/FemB family protein [Patescibacteria group bacterium]